MNYIQLILAGLTIAGVAGGTAAWFKRGEGKSTLQLAESTIAIYKERETAHLQQIAELIAANSTKDKVITEQRSTIKAMVKEFKEYKNGS